MRWGRLRRRRMRRGHASGGGNTRGGDGWNGGDGGRVEAGRFIAGDAADRGRERVDPAAITGTGRRRAADEGRRADSLDKGRGDGKRRTGGGRDDDNRRTAGRAARTPASMTTPSPRTACANRWGDELRRSRRAAGADEQDPPPHRRDAGQGAADGGDPDDVQRSGPAGRDGLAAEVQGDVREGARGGAGVHVLLRQGGRAGAARNFRTSTRSSKGRTSCITSTCTWASR